MELFRLLIPPGEEVRGGTLFFSLLYVAVEREESGTVQKNDILNNTIAKGEERTRHCLNRH